LTRARARKNKSKAEYCIARTERTAREGQDEPQLALAAIISGSDTWDVI
jgi:hypothetical protein